MTAVAVPLNPRLAQFGRLTKDDARGIFQDLSYNPFIATQENNHFASLDGPRIGYRKWRSLLRSDSSHSGAVDIHDDGSVALAFIATLGRDLEAHDIHVMDAHHLPAQAVGLVQTTAKYLGISGSYELQLNIQSQWVPYYIRPFGNGHLVDRMALMPIHRFPDSPRFHPVRALVDGQAGDEVLLGQVHSLALDLLNQAGITEVQHGDGMACPDASNTDRLDRLPASFGTFTGS